MAWTSCCGTETRNTTSCERDNVPRTSLAFEPTCEVQPNTRRKHARSHNQQEIHPSQNPCFPNPELARFEKRSKLLRDTFLLQSMRASRITGEHRSKGWWDFRSCLERQKIPASKINTGPGAGRDSITWSESSSRKKQVFWSVETSAHKKSGLNCKTRTPCLHCRTLYLAPVKGWGP